MTSISLLLNLVFLINAYASTSSHDITQLKAGVSLRGMLGVEEYHYYKYTNIVNNTDVVFALTGNCSYYTYYVVHN